MATKSIKAQCLEFLTERVGYIRDYTSTSRKYQRYILPEGGASILPALFDRPIYVGHCGAFRIGNTLESSISATDDIRRLLKLPAYGDMGRCDVCHHTTIHDHRINHGCIVCGCRRYSGAAGWNGPLVDSHTLEVSR